MSDAAMAGAMTLWENRQKISKAVRRIWRLLRAGRARIAIFGLGGMGKTTLGKILAGAQDPYTGPKKYDPSVDPEYFEMAGDIPCTVVVPPGQAKQHRDRTWPNLFRGLAKGEICGVVNIVSYGYTPLHIPWKRHEWRDDGMRLSQFKPVLLAKMRQAEIDQAQELAGHLYHARKCWMVTLINKADIWSGDRERVLAHFEGGQYAKIIASITAQLGVENFHHEYQEASLERINLVDGDGELLFPVSKGYDDNAQAASLHRLVRTLETMLVKK